MSLSFVQGTAKHIGVAWSCVSESKFRNAPVSFERGLSVALSKLKSKEVEEWRSMVKRAQSVTIQHSQHRTELSVAATVGVPKECPFVRFALSFGWSLQSSTLYPQTFSAWLEFAQNVSHVRAPEHGESSSGSRSLTDERDSVAVGGPTVTKASSRCHNGSRSGLRHVKPLKRNEEGQNARCHRSTDTGGHEVTGQPNATHS